MEINNLKIVSLLDGKSGITFMHRSDRDTDFVEDYRMSVSEQVVVRLLEDLFRVTHSGLEASVNLKVYGKYSVSAEWSHGLLTVFLSENTDLVGKTSKSFSYTHYDEAKWIPDELTKILTETRRFLRNSK